MIRTYITREITLSNEKYHTNIRTISYLNDVALGFRINKEIILLLLYFWVYELFPLLQDILHEPRNNQIFPV